MGIVGGLVYQVTNGGGSKPDQTVQTIPPAVTPKVTPGPEEPPGPPPKASTEAEPAALERPAARKADKEPAGLTRYREPPVPAPDVVKPYRPGGPPVEEKKAAAPPVLQATPVEQPKSPEPAAASAPPPVPKPSPPVEPAKPTSGEVVWTGILEENAVLLINGRYAPAPPGGRMTGELPAVALNLTITPSTVRVHSSPSLGSVVLRNTGPRQTTVTIHWTAK